MSKTNCWEFKRCGRELNGEKAEELGICPAASEQRLDGVHDGINAGRACWVVAGSMCNGEKQGTFAQKLADCHMCDFYATVKQEEGMNLEIPIILLSKLMQTESTST